MDVRGIRRECDSPEIRPHELVSASVESLVAATRASREALHDLIGRIRGDRAAWLLAAADLPTRLRLTARQRARLRDTGPRP